MAIPSRPVYPWMPSRPSQPICRQGQAQALPGATLAGRAAHLDRLQRGIDSRDLHATDSSELGRRNLARFPAPRFRAVGPALPALAQTGTDRELAFGTCSTGSAQPNRSRALISFVATRRPIVSSARPLDTVCRPFVCGRPVPRGERASNWRKKVATASSRREGGEAPSLALPRTPLPVVDCLTRVLSKVPLYFPPIPPLRTRRTQFYKYMHA